MKYTTLKPRTLNPLNKNNTMQWIKASETLPPPGKDNNLKIDDIPFSGRYWRANEDTVTKIAFQHFNVAGKSILDSSHFHRIFWLDESQSTPAIPEDVETAAKECATKLGWNEGFGCEFNDMVKAFLAGAAHIQKHGEEIQYKHLKKILADLAHHVRNNGYGGHSITWAFVNWWWDENKDKYKLQSDKTAIPSRIVIAFEYLKQSLDCFVKFIPEKVATEDTKQMAMYSALNLVKDAINELTEAQAQSRAIPSSIVEQLEKTNPNTLYKFHKEVTAGYVAFEVHRNLIAKLRELLLQQPVQGNAEVLKAALEKSIEKYEAKPSPQVTGNVQILIDALIDLSNPGADYTIAQKALYVYDSSKPTGVNNGEREDQEALWKEIKDKFFLTNMLNPEWTEEFKKAYTITKK